MWIQDFHGEVEYISVVRGGGGKAIPPPLNLPLTVKAFGMVYIWAKITLSR